MKRILLALIAFSVVMPLASGDVTILKDGAEKEDEQGTSKEQPDGKKEAYKTGIGRLKRARETRVVVGTIIPGSKRREHKRPAKDKTFIVLTMRASAGAYGFVPSDYLLIDEDGETYPCTGFSNSNVFSIPPSGEKFKFTRGMWCRLLFEVPKNFVELFFQYRDKDVTPIHTLLRSRKQSARTNDALEAVKDRIIMKSGGVLEGRVIRETAEGVTIEVEFNDTTGSTDVDRKDIKCVEYRIRRHEVLSDQLVKLESLDEIWAFAEKVASKFPSLATRAVRKVLDKYPETANGPPETGNPKLREIWEKLVSDKSEEAD